jgi:Iodothyronine deiodinase
MSSDAYNYQRFGWDLEDGACGRWLDEAPALGTQAPGFELPGLEGRHHRLSDFRGRPVVIEFGAYTCPLFCGHLPAMEDVAREHPDTTFLVIYTREAHPGEVTPAHATQADKYRAAARLVREEPISRVILVDDLDGSVHRRYGGGWDSVFILDAHGRVVLRRAWNDPSHVRVTLGALADGTAELSESVEMAPPASRAGFGHGLLRGGTSAVLDFYALAPPPVRQRLETSASGAVRALVAAPGTTLSAGSARQAPRVGP